jgi:hypothetical protein
MLYVILGPHTEPGAEQGTPVHVQHAYARANTV